MYCPLCVTIPNGITDWIVTLTTVDTNDKTKCRNCWVNIKYLSPLHSLILLKFTYPLKLQVLHMYLFWRPRIDFLQKWCQFLLQVNRLVFNGEKLSLSIWSVDTNILILYLNSRLIVASDGNSMVWLQYYYDKKLIKQSAAWKPCSNHINTFVSKQRLRGLRRFRGSSCQCGSSLGDNNHQDFPG